jgi:threonine dehydratase
VGSAVKALRPGVKVLGAEPETASPYAYSLAQGGPSKFPDWQASFVDGAGGQSVTERMWQRMQPIVDGTITVTLDQTKEAMRLIAEKDPDHFGRCRSTVAGRGALTGQAGEGPIVCVVSGGNIDLAKFSDLIA